MTPEELSKLSPEEKQIRIAELTDWSGPFGMFSKLSSGKQLLSCLQDRLHGTPPEDKGKPEDECRYQPVPDYLNDLNAMRDAEKSIPDGKFELYLKALNEVCGADVGEGQASFVPYFATATQRADAFMLTVG